MKSTMRTKRFRVLDIVQQKYADHLTNFAFTKLRCEYERYEKYNLENLMSKTNLQWWFLKVK